MGMKEFGDLIRETREGTGLLNVEVATKAGISTSMLSDFERGKKANPPTPEILASLSDQLGLTQTRMLEAIGYQIRETAPPNSEQDPEIEELIALLRRAHLDYKDRFYLRNFFVSIGKVNRGEVSK